MAAPVVHSLGTITLNNGQVTVVGQSTAFDPAVEPGDVLLVDNGNAVYEGYVDTVISATELTLVYPWRGPSFLNIGFKVVRGPYHGDPVKAGPKLAENLTLTRTVSEGAATAQQVATAKAAEAAASAQTALEAEEDAAFHSSQARQVKTDVDAALVAANQARDTAVGAAGTATTKAGEASTSAQTATTKAQLATDKAQVATDQAGIATTKAGEASTSAQTATTKAGEASTSAQTSTTKAGEAAASAQAAATSEGNALTYRDQAYAEKVAATNAKNAAEAALDAFEDRYLKPKAVDPTTDDDGNPLLAGTLYWNTSSNSMRVYKGGNVWGDASANVAILRWRKAAVPAGTTVLTGNDDTGQGLAYTAGLEQVYLNGILLTDADYVRTNSGTITLAKPTVTESVAYILAPTPFTSSDVFTKPEANARFALTDLSNTTGPRGKEVLYAPKGQSADDFKENGRKLFEPDSPGLPVAGEWFVVETWVDLGAYWWVQVAEGFVTGVAGDSKKYKRKGNPTEGWGAWIRVRENEPELDSRYATLVRLTDKSFTPFFLSAYDKYSVSPGWTDFNLNHGSGEHIMRGDANSPDGTVGNYWHVHQTGDITGTYVFQIAKRFDTKDAPMFIRTCANGSWGAWRQVVDAANMADRSLTGAFNTLRYSYASQPAGGTNLNTLVVSGWYTISSPVNAPTSGSEWWYVEVVAHDPNTFCLQIARRLDANEAAATAIYHRTCQGGIWSPWKRVWSEDNLPIDSAWTTVAGVGVSYSAGAIADGTCSYRYKKLGRLCFIHISLVVANAGSAAGAVPSISLPFQAANGFYMLAGRETNVTGTMLQGTVTAFGTTVAVFDYINQGIIQSGRSYQLSGVYETAS